MFIDEYGAQRLNEARERELAREREYRRRADERRIDSVSGAGRPARGRGVVERLVRGRRARDAGDHDRGARRRRGERTAAACASAEQRCPSRVAC